MTKKHESLNWFGKKDIFSKRFKYIKTIIELVKVILIGLFLSTFFILFILELVIVDGRSMEPTLQHDDRVVVEKLSHYIRKPNYDDVVVFKYPVNPAKRFIKRVIAVEGDRVKIQNNKIFINGKVKDEPYIFEKRVEDFNEVEVPKDTVFVLGDNRNNSKDSRNQEVGFVSLEMITGRAVYRLYPIKMIGRVK